MNGYGQLLLFDNSVWALALDGRLVGDERETFEQALAAGELWTCPPTLLEMRYSARDGNDFATLAKQLGALPHVSLDAESAASALTAQAELAKATGISHRVKLADLLIAAIASTHSLGVLHYDHDYDTIERHTSLSFESVWVAPRGSID